MIQIRNRQTLLLALILAGYFFFSLCHLSAFMTADEHYWVYERIPQYWQAVSEGNWKKTLINDKPGVSLALVSGVELLVEPHPETLCTQTPEKITTCQTKRIEHLLLLMRLPIVFLNALLLLALFWIIRRLTRTSVALWSTAFMSLSPILLGISQIINPDALLWSFGSVSLFSFFTLLKEREKKFIFFSGLGFGLALLSKYTAAILMPFFLLLAALHPFFLTAPLTRTDFTFILKKNIFFFLSVVALAICSVLFFLPAVWLKPHILAELLSGGGDAFFSWLPLAGFALFFLDTLIFKNALLFFLYTANRRFRLLSILDRILSLFLLFTITLLIVGRFFFPHWALFENTPFDIKDLTTSYVQIPALWEQFLLELNPLVFSLTPIVLFFLGWLLLRRVFTPLQGQDTSDNCWPFETFSLILFLFLYLLVFQLSDILAIPRYLILLYPVSAFLAALGAWDFLLFFSPRLKKLTLSAIILATSVASVLTITPFYFNYANRFLPNDALISHAWGYGGYEAAQYLNTLPNAENMTIWSDYIGVCEFFKGQCVTMEYKRSKNITYDYYVLTRRGKILYNPEHITWSKNGNFYALPAYQTTTPDWQLFIDQRPDNFIRVVKAEQK